MLLSALDISKCIITRLDIGHIIHNQIFVQRDLTKRRENKARAELAGKTDKVNQLRQEIAENENQLNMAQASKQ